MTGARFPDLAGSPVLVTGGGSGIGAALVEGFAGQGAKVAFLDLLDASAFARDLAARTGAPVRAIRCDLTDLAQLDAAIEEAEAAHGPARVLVNNAANDQRHDAALATEADWDASQAVNLRPVFFASRRVAAAMPPGGAIVNLTSIAVHMGIAGMAPYVAAKAGIIGLTRSLAREWGPRGLRVNALAPGMVLTERQRRLWITPEVLAAHQERQCLKVEIAPEDVVEPALFLASSASRMVTGQVLAVDAGVVALG